MATTILQLALQGELAVWVRTILRYYPSGSTDADKFKPFSSSMKISTFKALKRGIPVEREFIVAFAHAANLEPLDRKELFIRWGEALLGQYVYEDPKGRVIFWAENFLKGTESSMARVIDALTQRDTHNFGSFVRAWSMRHYGQNRGLEIRALARKLPMSEKGLHKALLQGCLKAEHFLQLRHALQLSATEGRALSRLYIEAQVGENILTVAPGIFEQYVKPDLHTSYLRWLLCQPQRPTEPRPESTKNT